MLRFMHGFFYRLLDILAGRKDPAGLRGTLLLDGSPPPENFKCMVGYVVQVCSYKIFYVNEDTTSNLEQFNDFHNF